jgi:hypothetical protein
MTRPINSEKHSGIANKITHRAYFPIAIILLFFIVLGVLFSGDYGESWDEKQLIIYADTSIDAYAWWGNGHQWNKDFYGPSDHRFYGPAYLMLARNISKGLENLPSGWSPITNWHFVIYLTFVLAIYCLYALLRRFVSRMAALGSTLLFASQPLLWGHAFINPKDIPFMAFFLASVLFGFHMVDSLTAVDRLKPKVSTIRQISLWKALADNYRKTSLILRKIFFAIIGLASAILLLRTIGAPLVTGGLSVIINRAYNADPASLLGKMFSRMAQHAATIPVGVYIDKGARFVQWAEGIALSFLLMGIVLLAWAIFLRPRKGFSFNDYIPLALKDFASSLVSGRLIIASIFLGLSISIRTIGPAAGLLVTIYFLISARRRALVPLAAYILVSAAVAFFSWPYLWLNPIENFFESVKVMSSFPFPLEVLFSGAFYAASELPRRYFPQLLALQFTLPALALAIAGLVIFIQKLIRKTANSMEMGLLLGWFFVPFVLVIIIQPPLYDNFRQFFFLIPPLFLLTGLSLDFLLRLTSHKMVQFALLGLLIAPGIYWGVQLHPYQYTYYNMLTGGVGGAFRQYETDYWATSFQEAAEYINQVAPPGATIAVTLPVHIIAENTRPDIKILYYFGSNYDPTVTPDFVIASTRLNFDKQVAPEFEVVHEISRANAVFAVIKQPTTAQD